MVPLVGEWMALLEDDEGYSRLVDLNEVLKETSFQVWYPDEKTAEVLYTGPALETGITEAPIVLPQTGEEMRARIRRIRTESPAKTQFVTSADRGAIGWLDFIASRHFRTPPDPAFWQELAKGPSMASQPNFPAPEPSGGAMQPPAGDSQQPST